MIFDVDVLMLNLIFLLFIKTKAFSETKVYKFAMPSRIQHYVLGLQITVDNKILMEMFETTKDLSHIKLHVVLNSDLIGSYATQ